MSDLPEGWAIAVVPDLADNLDSMRIPVNRTERERRPGVVPYYGATGQVGWIDRALFDEELCLVGEDGAPFHDRLREKAYVISGPSWVNNHAHVLRARPVVTSNRYLKHALDWLDYGPHVNGTTRLKLTKGALTAVQVPLAPLREQRRIVAAIEEQFSRLDAASEALGKVGLRIHALRRGLLHSAFTGLPTRALGELATTRLGKMLSEKARTGVGSRPYLRNKNVQWGWIGTDDLLWMDFSERDVAKFSLARGDVLVCEGGEVGRAAIWHGEVAECCFQKALHRVRCGPDLLPEFLTYAMRWLADSHAFDPHVTGSTIKHLPQEGLRLVRVPAPPVGTQELIVAEIERRLSVVDAMRGAVDSSERRSAALRRSILERAFRGELVPQDPSDEPASVLLERIRAERAATPVARRRRVRDTQAVTKTLR